MLNRWHAEDREVVLHQLGTDPVRGLAPAESSRRLLEHGPNLVRRPGAPGWGPLQARIAADPLLVTLMLAAAGAGALRQWRDCVAIGAAVALNGLFGFLQERRLAGAPKVISRLSAVSARVVRGGKTFLIPAAELVPGDLAEVAAGERVAADMRLYAAEGLFVDESALTGESLPTVKDPAPVLDADAALADRANMLFAGTVVTAGRGTGVVTATGMRTELGRIARLLSDVETGPSPLRRRTAELGQQLALAGLAAGAIAFAAVRMRGADVAAAAAAAAGLLVAVVPAGLPWVVTASLAAGARRLAARGVTAGSLPAVETLGAVSVIGTDKTGTLTRNELTVRELFVENETLEVTGTGYAPEGEILRGGRVADAEQWESLGVALRIGALCSDARLEQGEGGSWRVVGDPTDGALLSLAAKGGARREELEAAHARLARLPFTAERRRMTVVVAGRGGRPLALTKGEPDVVLAHCLHQRTAAGVRPLSPLDRERILRHGEEMAARALRVVGLAYREDATGHDSRTIERAMVWVGLAGMRDPARPDASAAIAEARRAGISPVIVTGDHKPTALAVAGEIGALRPGDEAITGEELERLSPEALGACVERYRVYARVTAEHRLGIIRAWKRRGHLIAMTGDGINDAPALKEASIGIAMGRGGTEVTREAASIVIDDDSFSSIVGAVAEGRAIFGNIGRLASYLVVGSAAAAAALLGAAAAGAPPPLVTLQLLWGALGVTALPALALGLEPKGEGVMSVGPPSPRSRILGGRTGLLCAAQGLATGAATLAAFLAVWRGGDGNLAAARGQAFVVLGLSLLLQSFAFRARVGSGAGVLPALRVAGAAALGAALLAASVQVPLIAPLFSSAPVRGDDWPRVAALALAPVPLLVLQRTWLRGRDGC